MSCNTCIDSCSHHCIQDGRIPSPLPPKMIFLYRYTISSSLSFPGSSVGEETACNAGDSGSIPGWRRSAGEGIGYTLLYSGLENSMDSIVHGVARSWTGLSDSHFFSSSLTSGKHRFDLHHYSLFLLWLSYKCNPRARKLWDGILSVQCFWDSFKLFCLLLFSFYCWKLFHFMDVSQFASPFTRWNIFGLFSVWVNYKQNYRHSYAAFVCVWT